MMPWCRVTLTETDTTSITTVFSAGRVGYNTSVSNNVTPQLSAKIFFTQDDWDGRCCFELTPFNSQIILMPEVHFGQLLQFNFRARKWNLACWKNGNKEWCVTSNWISVWIYLGSASMLFQSGFIWEVPQCCSMLHVHCTTAYLRFRRQDVWVSVTGGYTWSIIRF
jgi:hypothetical protein